MSEDLPVHPWCPTCGSYLIGWKCDRCSSLAAPAGSAPGNWYKAYEMEDLLKASPIPQASDNYDFCIWLSGHMNLALGKGWELAQGKAQNEKGQP